MILAVNNLSCERQENRLFENISFEVRPGEVLWIKGPNGSGKSSLLRLIAGLATPASGSISWQNTDITEDLHYIGHHNGIKHGLSVLENIQLAGHLCGVTQNHLAHCHPVLASLDLDQQINKLARYLSAGQKRRLALAKLFLFSRKLWLLDEPFTSLDMRSKMFFTGKLEEHLQNGGMCIMSTHDPVELSSCHTQTLQLAAWERAL